MFNRETRRDERTGLIHREFECDVCVKLELGRTSVNSFSFLAKRGEGKQPRKQGCLRDKREQAR